MRSQIRNSNGEFRIKSELQSPPFLSIKDAAFRLGDRLVFQNTSWVFRTDEQWALVGPNGSGKSLFVDALRGKLPLVHGELRYDFAANPDVLPEESIGHVAFEDRKQAVHGTIAQSRWNSLEHDSARTVANFLSYEHVMSINPFEVIDHAPDRAKFERRLKHAISLLEVGRFLSRDLLSLSNGETQRVHLARALSLPLRLLILDEPFTGLDAASRAFLKGVLEDLMLTRLKVLFVTARPEDLPRGISHCLWIENCQVVAAAPRLEADRRPKQSPCSNLKARRRQPLAASYEKRSAKVAVAKFLHPSSPAARTAAANVSSHRPILAELRNVTVRYGSATILDDVNWTIYCGESWALLGPNGAGKTTLLSLVLADNPQAYTNDVTVFGKKRGQGASIWELKRQIGCVSPELHLHFDDSLACLEAVLSGFHDTVGLFETPKRSEIKAARQWLDRFQLRNLERARLFSLSPGQQRMVLLARALVKRPKLLVLDEPCQGLDAAHRDLFLGFLDPLIASGQETAIYVTHRKDDIPRSIRHVLRLEHGKVTMCS